MKTKTNKKKTASYKPSIISRISRLSKPVQLLIVAVLFGAVGALVINLSSAATNTSKVGDHPQAILQSTADGKRIHTLKTWNGNIYAGYGDYSANTGPIGITPFNGSAFGNQQIAADTEAIFLFREINGILYGLSADPKSSADVVVGVQNSDGTVNWTNKRFVGTTHAYDIFTLTGTDLWLVGSQGSNAKAWRSLDGGVTWQESLSIANINTTRTDDFARFYGAIVRDGKIYVQAKDYYGGTHPTSKVFDGQSWSDGPYIGNFNSASTFAGKSVYHGSWHVGNYASLSVFDGTKGANVAPTYIYNYTIDGDTLYALAGDGAGTIYKTKDLVTWTKLGASTSVARSIAVLNGEIFIGGTDAAIYKVTVSDVDITPPTAQITAPTYGATVSGTTQINGTSTDNVGVIKTEFLINNSVVATDTSVPYSFSWNTTTYPNSSYNLALKSYDEAGNSTTSANVEVTVNNVPDTTAPVVSISAPLPNSTIPTNGRVKITARSTDNIGVAKSEVWVDGKLMASSTNGDITSTWNAKKVASGSHTITAKAYDAVGNVGSATVTVTKP